MISPNPTAFFQSESVKIEVYASVGENQVNVKSFTLNPDPLIELENLFTTIRQEFTRQKEAFTRQERGGL